MGIFRIFPGKYFITAYYFWTETRNEALLPGKTTILYRKWGMACLRFLHVAAFPVVLIGVFSCLSLELFNRYRAYMYNTLLQQYKKRKQICSTKSE